MKERLAGFLVMTGLVPLAIIGYFFLVYIGFFGKTNRGRAGVRALDHFVNATVFNGYAWETVSSHAWRMKDEKRWARFIVNFTNFFQKNHCERSSKRERCIVELVEKKELWKKTL